MLEIGTTAPAFSLPDQNGQMHTLEEYRGKKVILYFYPRDNTPGCTKQACGFAQLYPQFTDKGAVILGISKDSVKSHKNFETKYGLPFTLLSDTRFVFPRQFLCGPQRGSSGESVGYSFRAGDCGTGGQCFRAGDA